MVLVDLEKLALKLVWSDQKSLALHAQSVSPCLKTVILSVVHTVALLSGYSLTLTQKITYRKLFVQAQGNIRLQLT